VFFTGSAGTGKSVVLRAIIKAFGERREREKAKEPKKEPRKWLREACLASGCLQGSGIPSIPGVLPSDAVSSTSTPNVTSDDTASTNDLSGTGVPSDGRVDVVTEGRDETGGVLEIEVQEQAERDQAERPNERSVPWQPGVKKWELGITAPTGLAAM
jgi:hypothetical protein